MSFKSAIKATPLLGRLLTGRREPKLVDSGPYWEARYRTGGNSGAGSYSRLAEFKAEVLNRFVDENGIASVVEFGSGDGAQLTLANYRDYVGIDVSETAVELCRAKFAGTGYKFLHQSEVPPDIQAELALSLDVIYHLVEDQVFESYMRSLFDAAARYAIIYASNHDAIGASHVRHRKFSTWVERNRPEFELIETIPNRYPFDPADPDNSSFADFYIYRRH
ncbi:MAG TPA: hypothetical protein VF418_04945 [Sphingomonadaceae bacterium]